MTKRKKFALCCTALLAVLFFSYGMLLQEHYSKDIYYMLACGDSVDWNGWLSLGRVVPTILKQILFSLGLSPTDPLAQTVIFFVLTWIAMCFLMAALLRIREAKTVRDYFVLFLVVSVSVINPFYLEWFLFPECYFMFGISSLLCAAAIYVYSGPLTPRRWAGTLLLVVLAVNSYQACLGICFGYILVLSLLRHKFVCDKSSLQELGKILVVHLVAAASNLIVIKLVATETGSANGRGPSLTAQTLVHNIQTILQAQGSFAKNAFRLLPGYAFAVILLFLAGFFLYEVWQNRNQASYGSQVLSVLQTVLVVAAGYASVFAVQALSGNLWMSPRTVVGAFCSVACVILILYYYGKGAARQVLTAAAVIVTVFMIFGVQRLCADHLISNHMEQQEVQIMLNQVDNYEQETGRTVTKIAITSDASIAWGYPGITSAYDINTRATAYVSYLYPMLEWMSGRQFELVDYASVKSDDPAQQNWDSFNVGEQIDVVDDTLCIIIY